MIECDWGGGNNGFFTFFSLPLFLGVLLFGLDRFNLDLKNNR